MKALITISAVVVIAAAVGLFFRFGTLHPCGMLKHELRAQLTRELLSESADSKTGWEAAGVGPGTAATAPSPRVPPTTLEERAMAHMIDLSNNRENMAYVGERPWHGLGQQLTPDAGLDVWLKEAGLQWTVEKASVRFQGNQRVALCDFPDRFALYRSDTGAPLGIVSGLFKPVQPAEVIEFYRDLTEAAGFQLETAGVLKGGAMYWALAKTNQGIRIQGQSHSLRGELTDG